MYEQEQSLKSSSGIPTTSAIYRAPLATSWRTEPEVDSTRQAVLRQCLAITPDVKMGIYPFKDVKLSHADVEWLLVTHEQGRGPVDWDDVQQRERQGLDLRGADLRHVNLKGLPLACMCGGLTRQEWVSTTLEQRVMAGVHLEYADLSEAHLEGALLRGAFLDGATLRGCHMRAATLFNARLQRAYLRESHFETANLIGANLEGAYLRKANLAGADLHNAFFDKATNIEKIILANKQDGCAALSDVHWGDVNLSVVDWSQIKTLGDEKRASAFVGKRSKGEDRQQQIAFYRSAIRANRQLANAMRAQGMNDEAIPFAYRAQVLERRVRWLYVLWGQAQDNTQAGPKQKLQAIWQRIRNAGAYLFSWFLDILAGYGYKPGRSLGIYLLMIVGFTIAYNLLGSLPMREALIFSVTSFHGRGFLPGPFALGSPVTALAAVEAVAGLFIEISFIATFTQRFFGR